MINKLKNKITIIVLLAISIPLLIIIISYNITYYNSVIDANVNVIDRFSGTPNNKRDKQIDISDMDGMYSVTIKDGEIKDTSDNVTDEIKQIAIKVIDNKDKKGIIDNYIYKVKASSIKEKNTTIILLESSSEISKIKIIAIISVVITGIGILLIYILSKKISTLIVKPVEDTFNKQRDFISDASHELKTPLAVIQANADVLEGDIGKNKWLKYIQNETDNMSKLINELLLLTKIENIDKLREAEKFNMSDHTKLIVSSFESMAFEKKVKIESEIESDIITDTFNKDDITHILSTLIDNAIKHTEENNKVIVELEKNKDTLIINVKNKGKEIPVSERKKIFDRFYRIDKSRNRDEKRYGLGLSIAKAVVLKNNGTIQIDYKNGYTIFTVKLPL